MKTKYKVVRLSKVPAIDANWNKSPWNSIQPLTLNEYMGRKPEYVPKTQVKIAYDANTIYVIFHVNDRYVRAVAQKYQDQVCSDSCVEFFFTPGNDVSEGYFNIEMNCGGVTLFHFQKKPRRDSIKIAKNDYIRMRIAHSLPEMVDPEIKESVTWTVEYSLPIAVLENYCSVIKPKQGVIWRANFYKCGDKTSHLHWLTWSFVDFPKPDFHLPDFFGALEFE